MNERIRAHEVRLIGPGGENLGIVPIHVALQRAREAGLDLVEVAPQADPPVVRIMDYGKYKYEQSKRDREAHRKTRIMELKRIRMTPKIGDHDFQTKAKMVYNFLQEGHKVKVEMWFRGREAVHPELGRMILDRLTEYVSPIATVERPPSMEGRNMVVVYNPARR
ncbi:MAG: translation initiation factor IF-3 [Armatimonadota bacterium]|nr:translation initiation factor IF-3 [Armatimonadota bacterium]MDR7443803.1 translation initiation factor IF-3 [Armatimonadota bacterium]MDR7569028.1 translation initiation factor IF-3 [Armatimonadota bacterium]MDR7613917.1 translation initiation factor IF-3 [Armatimonadota bacterium]